MNKIKSEGKWLNMYVSNVAMKQAENITILGILTNILILLN